MFMVLNDLVDRATLMATFRFYFSKTFLKPSNSVLEPMGRSFGS